MRKLTADRVVSKCSSYPPRWTARHVKAAGNVRDDILCSESAWVADVFISPMPNVDKRPRAREQEENAMTRAPMKLDLKKNRLHKDVGKAPGVKLTKADIAKEKSKGGVFAKRAQFAENARKWNHPGKGKR